MNALDLSAQVVTKLDTERHPLVENASLDSLLETLCNRANRLVDDRQTCDRLKEPFRIFLRNVVGYFQDNQKLDDYTVGNIATALACSDNFGSGKHGIEDYSTFIRRLNPMDPETNDFFIIGREGKLNDPECPLRSLQNDSALLSNVPFSQLHMFYAFSHARSLDSDRGAPKIPVTDFFKLIPHEITSNPDLEEAFLDVCFSDGAWELYQLKAEGDSSC